MKLLHCLVLFTSLTLVYSNNDILDYIHGILGHKFNSGHQRPLPNHHSSRSTRQPVPHHSNHRAHTIELTYTTEQPSRHPHYSEYQTHTKRPYTTEPSHYPSSTKRHYTSYTEDTADSDYTTREPDHTEHDRAERRPGYSGSRYRANDRGDSHLSITGTKGTWSRYLQFKKITFARYTEIKDQVRRYIKLHPEMIPRWVQLAFHDCSGARGCDGCMDQRHAGNHGLLKTIDHANIYHKQIADEMSRPDFYILLGTEAAQAGTNYSLNIPYKTGRRDCYLDGVTDNLPAGDDPHAFEFLMEQFDLTANETIALLGAHSLGGAHSQHSGFHGEWDLSPLQLDNSYYKAMRADLDWEIEQLENKTSGFKSSQWTSKKLVQGKSFLMLHTDMTLKYNFECSGDYKMPSCDKDSCQTNESRYKVVNEFADSQELFYEFFSRAFTKMTSKGSFTLYAPTGSHY